MYYMYSLEPPIYYYLNQACRTMDKSKLDTLGPYALVLYKMLYCGRECDGGRVDKMRLGEGDGYDSDYKPTTPLGYFSQSFFTFRGVKMGEQKWFDAYLNKVGKGVCMPGTTSTSSDL